MIVIQPNPSMIPIGSVPAGDCFFKDNNYYMKIESFQGNENAVHLRSGKCVKFLNDEEVMLLHNPMVRFD